MRRAFGYHRSSLAPALLSLLFPSTCPQCKAPSDRISHAPFCARCWQGIKQYSGPSCRVCAAPLVSEYSGVCQGCLTHTHLFSKVLSYGLYSGTLREAIHHLKFTGIRRLAKPLGRLLCEVHIPVMDGIVPVPLSKKTLKERGFNQTLLLARVLSKESKMPLHMDVLCKRRETAQQINCTAKERLSNLKDAFEVNGNIEGLRLILLDDVMTTGATARECSKTLIKAGAAEVLVLTLARSAMF